MKPGFTLTEQQNTTLFEWLEKENNKVIADQKTSPPDVPRDVLEACWEEGNPYGGAIGGALTYSFTPTSIGMVVVVKNGHTGNEIDLTDYRSW